MTLEGGLAQENYVFRRPARDFTDLMLHIAGVIVCFLCWFIIPLNSAWFYTFARF